MYAVVDVPNMHANTDGWMVQETLHWLSPSYRGDGCAFSVSSIKQHERSAAARTAY
jgi:hypothetical protein